MIKDQQRELEKALIKILEPRKSFFEKVKNNIKKTRCD